MLLYLSILVAIFYGIYRYRCMLKGFENVEHMFPGKPTIPGFGNALEFLGNLHDLYNSGCYLCLLYRRTFRIWIGPYLLVCVQKPSDIEAVLNNTVHIKKAKIYDFLLPWIKRGLLTSYGAKWKKNRKLLTPAFHFKILDSFLEVFNRNGAVMCQVLEKKVGVSSFDVMDIVRMCALDNICETAMGVELNSQMNPSSNYVEAIKTMCQTVTLRTIRPWLRNDFFFSLTKHGKEQAAALKILHTFTKEIIEKRIKQRLEEGPRNDEDLNEEMGIKNKRAFLDLLLDYYDEGSLTLEEVQEEVDTFMFEGHDTVTSAFGFALYSVANHPEYQARAYEEQVEIFGKDDRAPTTEDLQKMRYLEMVLKESLRLYPSVAVFGRYIEQDLKLDDHSTIPAGAEALIMVPGLHRSPDIWEQPGEFQPDRFLPENSAKRHPYSYIPFSAGPRNCIGMRFAMMEMKASLSKVLRRFQLKPSDPQIEVKLSQEVILQSITGAHIALEYRK